MSTDDSKLLDQFARSRGESAFRSLYRCHTPMLYALALRLTGGSGADAEEIVQDAWVRAVENLSRFQRRSSFRTWLTGILVNCYRELRRHRARAPHSLDQLGEAGEARGRLNVERFRSESLRAEPLDVERALTRLPEGFREVVVLHDLNGNTHREIADLLGIEEGTSKSQLARGRTRLRELLRGASEERAHANKRGQL